MFLLVFRRPPCWCPSRWAPAWRLHTNLINLGKTFPRISRLRKIAVNWISARVFEYLPSFFPQTLDFIHWTVSIFIFIWLTLKTSNIFLLISVSSIISTEVLKSDIIFYIYFIFSSRQSCLYIENSPRNEYKVGESMLGVTDIVFLLAFHGLLLGKTLSGDARRWYKQQKIRLSYNPLKIYFLDFLESGHLYGGHSNRHYYK